MNKKEIMGRIDVVMDDLQMGIDVLDVQIKASDDAYYLKSYRKELKDAKEALYGSKVCFKLHINNNEEK